MSAHFFLRSTHNLPPHQDTTNMYPTWKKDFARREGTSVFTSSRTTIISFATFHFSDQLLVLHSQTLSRPHMLRKMEGKAVWLCGYWIQMRCKCEENTLTWYKRRQLQGTTKILYRESKAYLSRSTCSFLKVSLQSSSLMVIVEGWKHLRLLSWENCSSPKRLQKPQWSLKRYMYMEMFLKKLTTQTSS